MRSVHYLNRLLIGVSLFLGGPASPILAASFKLGHHAGLRLDRQIQKMMREKSARDLASAKKL